LSKRLTKTISHLKQSSSFSCCAFFCDEIDFGFRLQGIIMMMLYLWQKETAEEKKGFAAALN